MLSHIHVRNLAIVDAIEVELDDGMTALTGETGAGKSILVDALGLVLGDRADSGVIRHGAERAEITASFDISRQDGVRGWLAERRMPAAPYHQPRWPLARLHQRPAGAHAGSA